MPNPVLNMILSLMAECGEKVRGLIGRDARVETNCQGMQMPGSVI